jgi:AcrR family transcriptional regulator
MGRPREFDLDAAIDLATLLFWQKGYEGTSLSDLTSTIGVTSPRLYFAFGSKEGVFRRVIERYRAKQRLVAEAAFRKGTAKDVAEHLLRRYADVKHAAGWLATNSALPCRKGDPVRELLTAGRRDLMAKVAARFKQARREGDLPASVDVNVLARMVLTISWGMAVEAQSGATHEDLYRMIDGVPAGWPGPKEA